MPPGSEPVVAAGTLPVPLAAPSQADQLALAVEVVVGVTEVEAHTVEAVAVMVVHDEVIG